jgi:hypothetical protein
MTHDGAPPAAATAEQVQRLATAYQASRALHVAVRLGLPDLLGDAAARDAEDLARVTRTQPDALRRLLRALTAFGVFAEREDGRFTLGSLGGCLPAGVPGSVRPLMLMHGDEDFWRTWGELEHCVRTGVSAVERLSGASDAYARYVTDPTLGAVFNAGMTALSATTAAAVVAAYDFSGASRIIDVGGGQGRLIAAILRANPDLRGVLLDLPTVVAGAPALLADTGVAERCDVRAATFTSCRG